MNKGQPKIAKAKNIRKAYEIYTKIYENIQTVGFVKKMYREMHTYKGQLSKIYAGQASTIHSKAAFLCISDFPVQLDTSFVLRSTSPQLRIWLGGL